MTCLKGFIDPVFFVRWQAPELYDVPVITRDIDAARRSVDHPIAYIGVASPASDMPDDRTRAALSEGTKARAETCETIHLVLEGAGFKQSILRSAATGIFMLAGKRGKVFIQATMREALETAAIKLKFPVEPMLRAARAAGYTQE